MNEKEQQKFLNLVQEFAECMGVLPPKSVDIWYWWQEAVEKNE